MKYLKDNGFKTSLVKISPRAHVVTDEHIAIDEERNGHLGTTKEGLLHAILIKWQEPEHWRMKYLIQICYLTRKK